MRTSEPRPIPSGLLPEAQVPPAAQGSPLAIARARLPVVFHLRSSGGLFGADRVVLDLCLELPAAGYRALLVPLIEPGGVGAELRAAAEAAGVPVRPLILTRRFDLGAIHRLRRLAAIEGAEVLHGHDYKSNLLLALAAPPDTLRVATLHGRVGTDLRLRFYEAVDARLVRSFDRVICVSERMRALEARRGFQPITIHNGIDLERFAEDPAFGDPHPSGAPPDRDSRARLRGLLGLPADAEVVGSVGRLSAEKGYDVLLRAVARLVPSRPRLHLLLIGDGRERDALRQLADGLGIGGRLHLPGVRDDSPALYRVLDVFCLPSYREGMPLALLEAMAAGAAGVVTPVGGVPEVIGDPGELALTVNPGDVEGLSVALARLLDDSDLRVRLSSAARRQVEQRFSRDQMARAVAHLYDQLRGRNPERPDASSRD
jgi:glycosyltransferase involved in cell wall biosynthesis